MSAAAAWAPTRLGLTFAAPMIPPASPEPEEARGAAAAEPTRCVHPQLWQACAGSMCAVPPVGAAVYYFPQGHAEHAAGAGAAVDLRAAGVRVPPLVPCRVAAVRLMAEPDTDDVYARIRLVPLRPREPVADVGDALKAEGRSSSSGGAGDDCQQQRQKRAGPVSFAKRLTRSDADNGGGFSVPRFCALTVFPELDYAFDPPVQLVSARDVHGAEWTFRHIYRGTPRRHLLTTGWSSFVSSKRLQTGDSVVFVRDDDDDGNVHIGLQRQVRGNAGSPGAAAAAAGPSDGKVPAEDVIAAARLAAAGHPFEVAQYPRASAPQFCVRADAVRESMQVPWCPGLRFKMAFETEDLSRISWFMGTVAGVGAADPARWPQSPWRLLEVIWDEPELLRDVSRVCPWRIELVSNMPTLPRFSPPPCKKPRAEPQSDCRLLFDPALAPTRPLLPLAPPPPPHSAPTHDRNRHGFAPSFPFPDSIAAAAASAGGIQGVRHPQFAPVFSDLHLSSLQQSLLFCGIRPPADHQHQAPPAPRIATDLRISSPTTPRSPSPDAKKGGDVKAPGGIMLFGQAVLTEEQMMKSSNGSGVPTSTSPRATGSGSSKPGCDDENASSSDDGTHGSPAKNNSLSLRLWWPGECPASQFGRLEPGQCKVFMESDAVGRNLDLSALGSFDELFARLSGMFGVDMAGLRSHMVYRTIAGEAKHVGDEPFSVFVKSARRITILTDAGSDNTSNR